jgi:competence protein ComEA
VSLPAGRLPGWLQRRGIRIDPGRRGGLAMGVAALIAAVVAGWWVLSSRPHAVAVSSSAPSAAPTASSSGARSATPSSRLVVDVVGKVHHPGVYQLPDGARVDDALHAAGGALPGVDLSPLNLARKLGDGEQIAVGVPGAVPAAGAPAAGTGPPAASTSSPIDLNTATLAQLDTLPGVGPVLAQRIVDWRTAHGRFDSVDQLRDVTGIGDSRFADLKPLVTV